MYIFSHERFWKLPTTSRTKLCITQRRRKLIVLHLCFILIVNVTWPWPPLNMRKVETFSVCNHPWSEHRLSCPTSQLTRGVGVGEPKPNGRFVLRCAESFLFSPLTTPQSTESCIGSSLTYLKELIPMHRVCQKLFQCDCLKGHDRGGGTPPVEDSYFLFRNI